MPDSPVPPSGDEEPEIITGIHDVPKPMRTWAESQARKVKKIEKHFEPKGMVYETHMTIEAATRSFNFWIKVGPLLGALVVAGIGALMWLIHASVAANAPPQPPPPSAQDIAREVVKQQKQ